MSDLDKQIALGFEALGSNESFRRGLADAIIHEARRRKVRSRTIIALSMVGLILLAVLGYSLRNSQIVFGARNPASASVTKTLTTGAELGVTQIPFTTFINYQGDGKVQHHDWVLKLAPSNIIEFVTDIRAPMNAHEADLDIYFYAGGKPGSLIQRYTISSGTSIQEFGQIQAEGEYLVRLTMLDTTLRGRVRFIAVRSN